MAAVGQLQTVCNPAILSLMAGSISFSTGRKRHGKREKIVVAMADDSPEASAAAFETLKTEIQKTRQAKATEVGKSSYRKKRTV